MTDWWPLMSVYRNTSSRYLRYCLTVTVAKRVPNVRMSIVRGHRGVTFDWVSDLRLSRHINAAISDISTLVTTFITCRARRSISYLWKCTQAPGQISTQMTLMVSYFTEKIWNTQQGHVLYYLIQLCRCTVPPKLENLVLKFLSQNYHVSTLRSQLKWKYGNISAALHLAPTSPLTCYWNVRW